MRILMAALAATAVLAPAPPAAAAEAYVCDGGRVRYVEARDLERLKRTDRCIAAYYGLAVAAQAEPVEPEPRSEELAPSLPLVPINARETPRNARRAPTATAGTVGRIVEPAAPKPLPVAHPDTDFRSVRILNAAPGTASVYHHQR